MSRVRCTNCARVFEEESALTAPHPFIGGRTIMGCPSCQEIGEFSAICDEPGCEEAHMCGWNSPSGWRKTCWDHRRRDE